MAAGGMNFLHLVGLTGRGEGSGTGWRRQKLCGANDGVRARESKRRDFEKTMREMYGKTESKAQFSSHPVNAKTQKCKILRRNLTNLKY